ncbi:MAG: hypothetical protein M1812_000872 [Candelaria pacifica]|nr:MAG: hypothetical protein M1812_000872 [Candelaria pacifica]
MPPHLHPRSRLTTSLFTTTLLASFLVVGLPHILPCPVNTGTEYAEGEMRGDGQRRRRRRSRPSLPRETISTSGEVPEDRSPDERLVVDKTRECPVPKPGGRVGKMLGFTEQAGDQQARGTRIPVQTIIRGPKTRNGLEADEREVQRIRNDEAEPGG